MRVIQANLFDMFDALEFDTIAHGANCWCTMGSGVAKGIKERYPNAANVDHVTTRGDISKLGNLSWAYVDREKDEKKYSGRVYNLYTQFDYGYDQGKYARYDAISLCLYKLNRLEIGKKVGLPKLGCGLGGADWNIVQNIIQEICTDIDVTVCYL